jgi:hypothetical protein
MKPEVIKEIETSTEISKLKDRVAKLETEVFSLQIKAVETKGQWIRLDPAAKGFQKIETRVSPLLISVHDITPYLDGFKVSIDIGNPSYMLINNYDLAYQWGLASKGSSAEAVLSNDRSTKTNSEVGTIPLNAGAWTRYTLTLSPAKSEEIHNLWFTIQVGEISLIHADGK